MLTETENLIYKNFKKNKNKILKLLFPLPEVPECTDEELYKLMNDAQEALVGETLIQLMKMEDEPKRFTSLPYTGYDCTAMGLPFYRDSVGDEENICSPS